MTARLGNVLYWVFSGSAVLILLVGIFLSVNYHAAPVSLLFGIPAILVWLVGRACHYILGGDASALWERRGGEFIQRRARDIRIRVGLEEDLGLTRDRWNWQSILKRTTPVVLAIVAAIVGSVLLWGYSPAVVPQTEYAGLRIGMSPDEVMYIKGSPPEVLGDPIDVGWQEIIATAKLEKGKRVQDYRDWSYDKNTVVTFNEAKNAIVAIKCSDPYLTRLDCPPVAGVQDGDNESEVIQRLGNPDASRIENGSKMMQYRNLGIVLRLEKERVYQLGVYQRKYMPPLDNDSPPAPRLAPVAAPNPQWRRRLSCA